VEIDGFFPKIASRTIVQLCLESDPRPDSHATKKWWEQNGIRHLCEDNGTNSEGTP